MTMHTTPATPRVLECPAGTEYDEQAFGYFLALEQARAAQANQHVRLLLAAFEPTEGLAVPFSPGAAGKVFDGLRAAMRETDVIGWYRQGLVAGVVLTAWQEALADGTTSFERRVEQGLRERLTAQLARSLRVRVVEHATTADRSGM